jgi:hypothetical protein
VSAECLYGCHNEFSMLPSLNAGHKTDAYLGSGLLFANVAFGNFAHGGEHV